MLDSRHLRATISRAATRLAPARRPLRPRSRPRYRPALEQVERRELLATFEVTTTANTDKGSLHQAILDANTRPGRDTINFKIPGNPDQIHTITLQTELPEITRGVVINGFTQGNAKAQTSTEGPKLRVQLDVAGGT